MTYTAFGPDGPRIALAISEDAYQWERLGLARFAGSANVVGDDKDAAFFPEPVISPKGRRSLAFYHRPMLHLSSLDGRAAIPMIERMPFEDRESIRIAYVPLNPVLKDRSNLCNVAESVQVLSPIAQWGSIKIGAGTPPVRYRVGRYRRLAVGLPRRRRRVGRKPTLRYSAGIVIHDLERPDSILYRSPKPIMTPETRRERRGVVDNVVFPTGIDPRPDLGERTYDVYYGMGDYSIGAARMPDHVEVVLRYLLLSTAIVVGAAMVVAAWVNRDLIRIKIASVYARVAGEGGRSGVEWANDDPRAERRCAVGALGAARVPDANVGIERLACVRAGASAPRRRRDCASGDVGVW